MPNTNISSTDKLVPLEKDKKKICIFAPSLGYIRHPHRFILFLILSYLWHWDKQPKYLIAIFLLCELLFFSPKLD